MQHPTCSPAYVMRSGKLFDISEEEEQKGVYMHAPTPYTLAESFSPSLLSYEQYWHKQQEEVAHLGNDAEHERAAAVTLPQDLQVKESIIGNAASSSSSPLSRGRGGASAGGLSASAYHHYPPLPLALTTQRRCYVPASSPLPLPPTQSPETSVERRLFVPGEEEDILIVERPHREGGEREIQNDDEFNILLPAREYYSGGNSEDDLQHAQVDVEDVEEVSVLLSSDDDYNEDDQQVGDTSMSPSYTLTHAWVKGARKGSTCAVVPPPLLSSVPLDQRTAEEKENEKVRVLALYSDRLTKEEKANPEILDFLAWAQRKQEMKKSVLSAIAPSGSMHVAPLTSVAVQEELEPPAMHALFLRAYAARRQRPLSLSLATTALSESEHQRQTAVYVAPLMSTPTQHSGETTSSASWMPLTPESDSAQFIRWIVEDVDCYENLVFPPISTHLL